MKISDYKVGDRVFDEVHKSNGIVESIVTRPEDGHHEAFLNVRLENGNVVHLIEEQVSPSKKSKSSEE